MINYSVLRHTTKELSTMDTIPILIVELRTKQELE